MIHRMAVAEDVPSACRILNDIIKIGGTTAYQEPLSETDFINHFLIGKSCLSCIVCEDSNADILGFQALAIIKKLPAGWADIATFARAHPKTKGVGTLLFEASKQFLQTTQYQDDDALASSFQMINATIRADNQSGLSYYNKMGFVDYHCDKAVPLNDGTPVDRISKQYQLP